MSDGSTSLNKKYQELKDNVRGLGRVLVAFSGGVDSTLLLKVAKDVLGDGVLAVTAISPTTARHEREDAVRLAEMLGVEHLVARSRELQIAQFVENPANKCYVCKKSRFGSLIELAKEKGFAAVVDGENADDLNDYRPGMIATRELGVRSPLREVGLTKREIRRLSKRLDLPTWNKPPYACLATRIPYGSPITQEKLEQVDAGEDFLRKILPQTQIRVRHHGDTARIEVEPKAMAKLVRHGTRTAVVEYFKKLGFLFVSLDLHGYTMGSLNRTLNRRS